MAQPLMLLVKLELTQVLNGQERVVVRRQTIPLEESQRFRQVTRMVLMPLTLVWSMIILPLMILLVSERMLLIV